MKYCAHQNREINISWKFHVIRCFKYFHLKGAIIGGRQLIEGCLLFEEISIFFFAKSSMPNSAKMYGRSDTPHGFTIVKKYWRASLPACSHTPIQSFRFFANLWSWSQLRSGREASSTVMLVSNSQFFQFKAINNIYVSWILI